MLLIFPTTMNNRNKSEDLPILAVLCAAVIILPLAFLTSAFDVFGTIKYTLLVLLALLSVAAQLWLVLTTGKARLPGGRLGLAGLAFLTWLILSTAFSPVAAISFFGLRKRLLGLTTYIALALLLAAASRVAWNDGKIRSVFYSVCASITVSSAIGGAQFLGAAFPFDLKETFPQAAYSTFGNPNYFGLFLALVLPIPMYLALDGDNFRDRLIGYFVWPTAVIGLITAGSLGAFAGAVGSAGTFLIRRYLRQSGSARLPKIVAAAAVAIIVLSLGYAVTKEKTSVGERLWIWQASFQVSADRPVFGAGLDNLKSGLQRLDIKPKSGSPGGQYEDAHNIWLNLAASAGWPALLFALVFLTLAAAGSGGGGRPSRLKVRPKTPQAGQSWERRPKAPDARLTKPEARERMCDYVTEPRARKTQQTGFSAVSLKQRILPVLVAGGLGYLIAAQFNPEDLGSMPLFWIMVGIVISLSGAVKTFEIKLGAPVFAAAIVLAAAAATGGFFAVNALAAEINLLASNNATDIYSVEAAFKAAQNAQPWQTQYYVMEVYRLLPSTDSLKSIAGRETMRAAQKAISTNPGDPDNRLALGEIYRAVAQHRADRELHRAALDIFKQALAQDKYNDRAIKSIALTYKDLGDAKNSLRWIKTYERYFSPDPELADLKHELQNPGGSSLGKQP